MEQRISLITLGVADLDRSRDFYTNVVGWKPVESPPEIVFFDLGGIVLSLYPNEELAKDYGGSASDVDFRGVALAYNARSVEEVDGIFADLGQKGAAIAKAPEKAFWGGYSGYFADPDGHLWEVAFNPFWTITEEGRVNMSPAEE